MNKSYEDFVLFNDNFTTFLPIEIHLPSLDTSSAENLQKYISDILAYCDTKIWDHPILLRFLDEMYGKSTISKILIDNMTKKIAALESQLEIAVSKNNYFEQHKAMYQSVDATTTSPINGSIMYSPDTKLSQNENDDYLSLDNSPTEVERKTLDLSPKSKESIEPDILSTYDKSLLLPITVIPNNTEPNEVDNIIDDLLRLLRPHDEQIKFRRSIHQYIMNFVRRQIGCRIFDSTLLAIKCTLPDDQIKLSIAMSRMVPSNWFIILHDKLTRLSERNIDMLNDMNFDDTDDNKLSDLEDSEEDPTVGQRLGSLFENNLSNIIHTTTNGESSVTFNVDNLLVEISSNPRVDIGMMAFIEEFSIMIGRNFIFKKCLLLVRAWWIYETAAYIGCPMKHYISDSALAIMLCSIFNLYHENIHTPFQGLCIFLAEYGDFDWATSVVTLQGIVPFKAAQDDVPWLHSVKPSHLINEELINKYKNILLINTNPNLVPPMRSLSTGTMTSGISSGNTNINGIFTNDFSSNSALHSANEFDDASLLRDSTASQFSSLNNSNQVTLPQQKDSASLSCFERRPLNILNPFTQNNMISEKLNSRRAKRVIKVFQMGARNLCTSIKSSTTNISNTTEPPSSLLTFFRNVYNRFGSGWRPDVISKSLSPDSFRKQDFNIWNTIKINTALVSKATNR